MGTLGREIRERGETGALSLLSWTSSQLRGDRPQYVAVEYNEKCKKSKSTLAKI